MGADRFESTNTREPASRRRTKPSPSLRALEARRQLLYELLSGLSGVALALFMWGHMFLVGSFLTGARGFDALASGMEDIYLAQPTVLAITVLFLVHAAMASRKIPAQVRDRRRLRDLTRGLEHVQPDRPAHVESSLWIWQVWTGMVLLVFGSFHLDARRASMSSPISTVRTRASKPCLPKRESPEDFGLSTRFCSSASSSMRVPVSIASPLNGASARASGDQRYAASS